MNQHVILSHYFRDLPSTGPLVSCRIDTVQEKSQCTNTPEESGRLGGTLSFVALETKENGGAL